MRDWKHSEIHNRTHQPQGIQPGGLAAISRRCDPLPRGLPFPERTANRQCTPEGVPEYPCFSRRLFVGRPHDQSAPAAQGERLRRVPCARIRTSRQTQAAAKLGGQKQNNHQAEPNHQTHRCARNEPTTAPRKGHRFNAELNFAAFSEHTLSSTAES